jgi:DNA-binding beta-propeller fold protein YncE
MRPARFLLGASVAVAACQPSDRGPPDTARVAQSIGDYPDEFTLFETGQVRPLALSPDGQHLYALNTPDNRLEIFQISGSASQPLSHVASVQVGLEPVAVAARPSGEVWVVNHLSDSVSVVDASRPSHARVACTLPVGDEPRDVVFAGAGRGRAFITTAHRGQNNPQDPQPLTPGVGRADVWVFDAAQHDDFDGGGECFGGHDCDQIDACEDVEPLAIVTLFADTPRALAVSPDGNTVYAAAFHSGNRTATVHDLMVTNGGAGAPDGMGLPLPNTDFTFAEQPEVGLIVQHDGAHWLDELGRVWDARLRFTLPDKDVFAIDATASPPVPVAGPGGVHAGVGTILYNMAVNPVTGAIYVSNTDAQNTTRFEGPGTFAGSTVRGNVHQTRVTVIDGGTVAPRHLNKHVDFSTCCAAAPNAENDDSLAIPLDMAVSSDGSTLYLAAFGSSKIGVFDTADLENDTFVPDAADHIQVSGGGPSGLALDEARDRLYVLTRFDDSISVVNINTGLETHHIPLYNPEPASVVAGRRFLYDARLSSGNGTTACASCHVFGDFDSLAWDLGAPDSTTGNNPGPFVAPSFFPDPALDHFHALKGPMTTQSLRGLANHGPMHWRGDRSGANAVPSSAQPDTGLFDEAAAFKAFNPAFVGLNGRSAPLSTADMQAFTNFALQITYPPNPYRNLDNGLTAAQRRGADHFSVTADTAFPVGSVTRCVGCHVFNRDGNAQYSVSRPGFFGTDGKLIVEGDDFGSPETGLDLQSFKVPHFRNLYQKIGMFGTPNLPGNIAGDDSFKGPQIRGFGFAHDGSVDTIPRFLLAPAFAQPLAAGGFPSGAAGDALRADVARFLLAFDSNLAPIVGQQVTLTASNGAAVDDRIDLLIERASINNATTPTPHAPDNPHQPECELVVTTRYGSTEVGFLYVASQGLFVPSDHLWLWLTDAQLRGLAAQRPLTYTCVPLGSGYRIGLDADLDGCYNRTEAVYGHDPRNPASTPAPLFCL